MTREVNWVANYTISIVGNKKAHILYYAHKRINESNIINSFPIVY
jgi:hypothetical protein